MSPVEPREPGQMRMTVEGSRVKLLIVAENGDTCDCWADPSTAIQMAQALIQLAARARANEMGNLN